MFFIHKKAPRGGGANYGRESLSLQIKSINFSLLSVIECAIKTLLLFLVMKSKVLFSLIASASLFPFLLSSPGQAWDPEAEIRQQNQQRNQKQRLCDLAENNPTHLKYDKIVNQVTRKARVNGNQVTTVFVFTGPSAPFHQGCVVAATLGKEEFDGSCKNLYKIINGDLVHFKKCPDRNTLKSVYKKVGS